MTLNSNYYKVWTRPGETEFKSGSIPRRTDSCAALAEKARQRVEQVLKDKEARQKCEAQTAQEFADCGFTFED
jgi:hypothetical protein